MLKVGDEYRTNNLSLRPGGYEISILYSTGKTFVYDKVKIPGSYIKGIVSRYDGKGGRGEMMEIAVDGQQVWKKGSEKKPWEI